MCLLPIARGERFSLGFVLRGRELPATDESEMDDQERVLLQSLAHRKAKRGVRRHRHLSFYGNPHWALRVEANAWDRLRLTVGRCLSCGEESSATHRVSLGVNLSWTQKHDNLAQKTDQTYRSRFQKEFTLSCCERCWQETRQVEEGDEKDDLLMPGALFQGWDRYLEIRVRDTEAFVELVRLNADVLERDDTGTQLAFFRTDALAEGLFGVQPVLSDSKTRNERDAQPADFSLDAGLQQKTGSTEKEASQGGGLPVAVRREFSRLVPYCRWGLPAAAFLLTSLAAPPLFPASAPFWWLLSAPMWLGLVFWMGSKGASYGLSSWVRRRMTPLFFESSSNAAVPGENSGIPGGAPELLREAGFFYRSVALSWGEPGQTLDTVGRLFASLGGEPLIRGTLEAAGLPVLEARVLVRLVLMEPKSVQRLLAEDESREVTRRVLLEAFWTDDLEIKAKVVGLLQASHPEDLKWPLVRLLKEGREAEQMMAARALSEIKDPDLVEELESVYETAPRKVRVELDKAIMEAWEGEDTDPG